MVLTEARENDFGRRIFEAYASEFGTSHLNEAKEMRNKVEDLENLTKTSYAFYLKSSNLKDKL